MKTTPGELILLGWDGDNDVEYIRGHVTIDEGRAAYARHAGEDTGTAFDSSRHIWARWVPAERYSDYSMLLLTGPEQKRGMFAVTELHICTQRPCRCGPDGCTDSTCPRRTAA